MKHEDTQVPPADAGRLETPVRRLAPRPGPNGECYYCGALRDKPCHQLRNVDLAKNGCAALRKTPNVRANRPIGAAQE